LAEHPGADYRRRTNEREVEQFMKKIKFPFTIGYGNDGVWPLISYANWQHHRFESSGQQVEFLEIKVKSLILRKYQASL
jgi:long-subunit acyl-CoA synthetase (AMP-forming)